jgi:hypothetical protein
MYEDGGEGDGEDPEFPLTAATDDPRGVVHKLEARIG